MGLSYIKKTLLSS